MKEEKITISVNQEDVQNIINCYEKDIEYIKQLEEENKSLQSQLKAKEEVIKEVKNIIKNNCIVLDGSYTEVVCTGEYLLEILSKGENK